jgi:hypothetical protein
MHTEHLQNVTVARVTVGWLVAIAITSLVMLVLTAVGFSSSVVDTSWWTLLAVGIGFFGGGLFAGMRALQAPVLHGIGIGLMSLVAWVVVNAVIFGISGSVEWEGLTPTLTLTLLLAQIVAATLGALIGYNIAVSGKPGLSEHEPIAD